MMPRSILALFLLPGLLLVSTVLRAEPPGDKRNELLSPGELRADFHELRDRLYASHIAPFEAQARDAQDIAFERIEADLNRPMTREDAALLFQRFVAFGNIAHARVEDAGLAFAAQIALDAPIVPFDIRVVDGSMIVADVYPGGEGLEPGDRLLAIAGHPTDALRRAMHGDLSADTAYLADTLLEFEFPRTLWQQLGTLTAYPVVIERGGSRMQLELDANRPSERRSILGDEYLWLSWSERDAGMRDCDTAYLRPGPFYNPDGEMWDATAFHAFIDDAFEGFLEAGARQLVIDLRNNPGGDVSFSDHMLAWFADKPFRFFSSFQVRNSAAARAANERRMEQDEPGPTTRAYAKAYGDHADGAVFDMSFPEASPRDGQRFDGRVFVLVNRHSFSNAVTTAAMVQDYGFGTIVGEPTADLATTLGAMEQFTLTRTGLRVGFPKARIVRPSGNTERRGVQPDIPIATPAVEPATDPVLEEVLSLVCSD